MAYPGMQTECLLAPEKAAMVVCGRLVRILHLSAQSFDLEQCQALLDKAGFRAQIVAVQTRKAFLKALWGHSPDVIIAEYQDSSFMGLPALELAVHHAPFVPFIFYAERHGEEIVVTALKKGAVDYVLTEHPEQLCNTIVVALENAKKARVAAQLREQAEKAQRWLAALVESSSDAIISKDLNGTITSWNTGAERLFGYSAEEVIGKPITILLPPERLAEEVMILDRVRSGQRIDRMETVRRTKEGQIIDVSLTISPVKDSDGRILGVSKIARDIRAQKAANQQLREANERLGHCAEDLQKQVHERTVRLEGTIQSLAGVCYHIAHDLRAPVRAVRGFTELLTESQKEAINPQDKEYMRRIVQACSRMDLLIEDLLAYGRLSHAELPMSSVPLGHVLMALLDQFAGEIRAKNALVQIGQIMPTVWGNTTVLEQVFGNLLSNGLKYVARGVAPRIRITCEDFAASVKILFEDNGIGIPPAHQERVFHMFERLHPDSDYPGTGIGLAIVQKGVERLRGKVTLLSEVGVGSRFIIELPKPAPRSEELPQAA